MSDRALESDSRMSDSKAMFESRWFECEEELSDADSESLCPVQVMSSSRERARLILLPRERESDSERERKRKCVCVGKRETAVRIPVV